MLKINDLAGAQSLDRKIMTSVVGGNALLSLLFDASTSATSKVADINQIFGLDLSQRNVGAVTNNQAINNRNGIVYAPVRQTLNQSTLMGVMGLGNSSIT